MRRTVKSRNAVKNRRDSKQSHIVAALRQRIVSGLYQPQSPLPIRTELMAEFGVSTMTLQKVMDQLTREGFVRSRGASGTFVTQRPPHLSHYALVFDSDPTRVAWGQFWRGLVDEALAIDRVGERKITCYYGLHARSESEDYQTLVREVESGLVAGLIFSAGPLDYLFDTPLMENPGVARVGIMTPGGWPSNRPRISSIVPDQINSFYERAVEYLAERGRKSPAVFFNSGGYANSEYCDGYQAIAARYGMRQKQRWLQFVNVLDPQAALHAAQAVMHREQADPPDSLIITDDTMIESATAGLAALGLRVPGEVEVVAHCNYPRLPKAMVPVKRLGFSLREVLMTCIESIDRQRQGVEILGRHIDIPARFENELIQMTAPLVAAR